MNQTETQVRHYRWPLSGSLAVELIFTGPEMTVDHLMILQEYIELTKKAISQGEIP